MISIFLNLLRFVFWSNLWPILENVLCALDKDVYSAALKMAIRSVLCVLQALCFLIDFLSVDLAIY